MLERFGEVSGLKVNCQTVLWIGSLRGFDQIFCPEKSLHGQMVKIKLRGFGFVWISKKVLE